MVPYIYRLCKSNGNVIGAHPRSPHRSACGREGLVEGTDIMEMSKPPAVAQRKSQQMRGNRKARPAGLPIVAEPKPEHSVHAPPAAGAASGLGKLVLKGKEYEITDHDLERREHLGSGTYGEVCKVVHRITGTVMAVKVSEPCSMSPLDILSPTPLCN